MPQFFAAGINSILLLLLLPLNHVQAAEFADKFYFSDGVAIDRQNNLVWARCSVGQRWDAKQRCRGRAKGFSFLAAQKLSSRTWRVPTRIELESLFSPKEKWGDLNHGIFPQSTPNQLYWSSDQADETSAWYADFCAGTVDRYYGDYNFLQEKFLVRLVRSL